MEELDTSSSEDEGQIASLLNRLKRWFLSHAQYLNFFTILLLASVSQIMLVLYLILQLNREVVSLLSKIQDLN